MNSQQFAILVKSLKVVYARDNFLQEESAAQIWYEFLKDIPYEVLTAAVQKYIVNNKFAPTIADLRELSNTIATPETDWGDGWHQVEMAIRRYGMYQEVEAMESFDEVTRECVKRLGFKNICLSENPMTDRANFRMLYEQISHRKKEMNQLPQGIRNNIQTIQGTNLKSISENN